jgi:hypothetical protein
VNDLYLSGDWGAEPEISTRKTRSHRILIITLEPVNLWPHFPASCLRMMPVLNNTTLLRTYYTDLALCDNRLALAMAVLSPLFPRNLRTSAFCLGFSCLMSETTSTNFKNPAVLMNLQQ